MSINIPVAICRVAASVTVNVDTMKLGPQVYKKMLESIHTGEIAAGTIDGVYQRVRHPDSFSRTTGKHYRETDTYDWPKAESDEDFQKKLQHALRAGIHPMLAAIDTLHGEGESNEH